LVFSFLENKTGRHLAIHDASIVAVEHMSAGSVALAQGGGRR
jgi:hypothetical protein